MTLDRKINLLRMAGSIGLCAAYLLITSGYLIPGVLVNTVSQFALTPYSIRHKAWDFLAVSGFFLAANLRVLLATW
jgi:hypothetical protein